MKAQLPEIRTADDRLVDRTRPMQLVNNEGDDALVALAGLIAAGSPAQQMIGYQQIPNASLVSAMSLEPPEGAVAAIVQNNGTMSARWMANAADPTPLHGMRLYGNGDTQTFVGDLDGIRFIREGDNVILDIAYYG